MARHSVTISNRVAKADAGIELICNNPTDTIRFSFDSEWNKYTSKIARFSWEGKFVDIPFDGDEVVVPEIYQTNYVHVGVYNDDIASTPVKLKCRYSIKCMVGSIAMPQNETYYRLIKLIRDLEVKGVSDERIAELVNEYLVENPPQAEPGEDGISCTHSWNGTTLTVTSASGTSSADLKGEKGEAGEKGERGERGEQGIQGEAGIAGANGKDGVSPSHSWDGTVLNITSASGTSGVDLKGDKGDKGDTGAKGEDGTGVTILGSYASVDELNSAHPSGSAGDAYLINGDLYIWSETSQNWENVGNIKGPQGEQGLQGEKGEKGDTGEAGEKGEKGDAGADGISCTHSWDGTTLTVTSASGTSSADLKGEKGDKGDKGDKGEDATATVDSTVSVNSQNPVSGAAVYGFVEDYVGGKLPNPSGSDKGKFLRVDATGAYALVAVSNAEGVVF